MKTLKTNILIPAVALCIAGVLIVGKKFLDRGLAACCGVDFDSICLCENF